MEGTGEAGGSSGAVVEDEEAAEPPQPPITSGMEVIQRALAFAAGGKELVPGAKVTDRDAASLYMREGLRNQMSRAQIVRMMEVTNACLQHVPGATKLPTYTKAVDRLFDKVVGTHSRRLYFCPCRQFVYFSEETEVDNCPVCAAERFTEDGRDTATLAFCLFDFEAQIVALFGREDFAKGVHDHVNCHTFGKDEITTAYDTELWHTMHEIPGLEVFGQDARHLRLQFGADGVDVFSGSWSTHTNWPEVCAVLNLRPEVRYKSENLIRIGVTVGAPNHRHFNVLQTKVNKILHKNLLKTGVVVKDANKNKEAFVCRAMIYRTAQDGQALWKMYARVHGGFPFCPWCYLLKQYCCDEAGKTYLCVLGARRCLTDDCALWDMRQEVLPGVWDEPENRNAPPLKTQELVDAEIAALEAGDKGVVDRAGIHAACSFRRALPYWRAIRGDERGFAPDLFHIVTNVMGLLLDMLHGARLPKEGPRPAYVLTPASLKIAVARLATVMLPPGVSRTVVHMFGPKRKGGKSIDKLHLAILQLLPFAIIGLIPERCAPMVCAVHFFFLLAHACL